MNERPLLPCQLSPSSRQRFRATGRMACLVWPQGVVTAGMDRSGIAEVSMRLAVFLLFVIVSCPAWAAGDEDGATIYRDHCAQCHESGVARAPSIAALKQMSPDRIGTALVLGSMSTQGRDLTGAQLKSVVRFLD